MADEEQKQYNLSSVPKKKKNKNKTMLVRQSN